MIRRVRTLLPVLLILVWAGPAEAAPDPLRISGGSACSGAQGQRGSEVAPALAAGPGVLLAAWQAGPSAVADDAAALEVAAAQASAATSGVRRTR